MQGTRRPATRRPRPPGARPAAARGRWRLLGGALLTLGAGPLAAQVFGPPPVPLGDPRLRQLEEPGVRVPARPPFEPAGTRPPPVAAPAVSSAVAGPISEGLQVFVREVRIEGHTVFSDAELAEVTRPYTGRYLTSEDLGALRQALTLQYVERGYVNSGAVIPDQRVTDGVIRVRVVEGRLTEIAVSGNTHLDSEYLSGRLALGAGPPLNVGDLQEQIQILLQGPFVKRVNAELAPGDRPGEARLRAEVAEGSRYRLSVGADNDLSPSVGTLRALARGALYSPSGRGDLLSGQLAYADGLWDVLADYAVPLNAHDLTLDLFARYTRSEVVQEDLEPLDIEGETRTFSVRLSQPVYRTPRQELNLAFGLDLRDSETALLGEGFAFSPGVREGGEANLSVLRFVQDWVSRSRTEVLAARSTFSLGIDAFGATDPGKLGYAPPDWAPDARFFAWLGQFQYARRFEGWDGQVVFRLDGQLSDDPLLPIEQFAVGGLYSVRGYPTNQLVRDRGYATSLEVRVPVLADDTGRTVLQLVPFVDAGGAWYKGRPSPAPQTIASAGLGLRWEPHPRLNAVLYWGYRVDEVDNPGDLLDDPRVNFVLVADVFD